MNSVFVTRDSNRNETKMTFLPEVQPIEPLRFLDIEPIEFSEPDDDCDTLFEILQLASNEAPDTKLILEILELMLLKTHSNAVATKTVFIPKIVLNKIGPENLEIYFSIGQDIEEEIEDQLCEHCGKVLVSARALNLHMVKFHSKTNNQCDVCLETFPQYINLRVHIMKKHLRVNNFTCDECPKTSKFPSDLIRHYNRYHLRPRLFNCEYCNKSFARNDTLGDHIFSAHPETLKTCKKCKRLFRDVSAFKKHQSTKAGKRNCIKKEKSPWAYKCDLCNAKFMSYSQKREHKKKFHNRMRKM